MAVWYYRATTYVRSNPPTLRGRGASVYLPCPRVNLQTPTQLPTRHCYANDGSLHGGRSPFEDLKPCDCPVHIRDSNARSRSQPSRATTVPTSDTRGLKLVSMLNCSGTHRPTFRGMGENVFRNEIFDNALHSCVGPIYERSSQLEPFPKIDQRHCGHYQHRNTKPEKTKALV
jgi:hypothetical protein